jgi:UDP-N-acetylglucosamine 3-dehydrogenase
MAKIGIMSFAHMHAYSYAECINALPDAELTAVWGYTAGRTGTAAKQFGTRFIKDVNAFLDSDIEGVIICSENVRHRELVELAAAAGKWILCEKPLAPAVADAKAMVDLCERAKVGLGTAFPCRFAPALMAAREQLQNGDYGDIYAVTCTNHGKFPGGWFADPEWSGGGAVMDHTVHVADALRWMLGREFTNVYCEADNLLHEFDINVDDLGSLHMEMEGGIQVQHIASWSRSKTFPTWGDVTMEFIGSKGVLRVDAFNQKVTVYNDQARAVAWASYGDNPDLGLVRDFVDAIHEKRTPAASGLDGLRATEVTEAATKSMHAHRVVKV